MTALRNEDMRTVYDGYIKVNLSSFDIFRRDTKKWQRLTREVVERGHGAAILLYDADRSVVMLTKQYRHATEGDLIEVCAGMLDDKSPSATIRAEASEECGVEIGQATFAFEVYTSPGVLSERIACYAAPYTPAQRVSKGGGVASEGEDIEVIEMTFKDALRLVKSGHIQDAKTILLLQYAQLQNLLVP